MKTHKYDVLVYWSDDDKAFVAEVPDLPGCAAHGKSRAEAIANVEKAIDLWIAATREAGESIPRPGDQMLTVPEASQLLGLSVAMVRRYCAQGRLPAHKLGRDWAIRVRDAKAFAASERPRGKAAHRAMAQPA